MSYDRTWIESSEEPKGWLERREAEQTSRGREFDVRADRLHRQGHFVVLAAGANFAFDELFLFEDSARAMAFYESGFSLWECVSGDGNSLGFQEVSLYEDGWRIASKTCEPSRRDESE